MNIIKKTIISATLLLSTCPMYSQESPEAWFVSDDQLVCDAGIVNIVVGVKKYQQAVITITERDMTTGAETRFSTEKQYPQDNQITINRSVRLHHNDKHEQYMLILNAYESAADGQIAIADTMMVDIWGTPKARILNDTKICGYETTLEADSRWEDISVYHWATTQGTLSDADTRLSGISFSDREQTTFRVELTESTGNGKCSSIDEKEITLVGNPKAKLSTDAQGTDDIIRICTTVDGENGYSFPVAIDLNGNAPFDVKLTNGTRFSNITATHDKYILSANKAQTIRIERVTDANGCQDENDEVSGTIEVIDRKPYPTIAQDTFEIDNEHVIINIEKADRDNIPYWDVLDQYKSRIGDNWYSDAAPDDMSADFQAYTSVNGFIGITYYEVETGDIYGLAECPSDTYTIWINVNTPLNAPDGISPNGDGKNDELVIEGIPESNHIMVIDSRGKTVFETDNYCNNWNAEGIDDGYYVYIVEAPGMKTIRKTLVIKRSK